MVAKDMAMDCRTSCGSQALKALAAGLAAVVLSAAAWPGSAAAQDAAMGWVRFGGDPTESVSTQAYDRAFVRKWEANPPRGFPTLSRANIAATRAAIEKYEKIVKAGGWRTLPANVRLEFGLTDPAVDMLQRRLWMTGELREPPTTYFGDATERAVKRFQATHGLTPTGRLDARTRGALNVPADVRLKQLKVNLARLQEEAMPANRRYVVVNIPAAQIEAIEDDNVVSRHTGVVGKRERPTPILNSRIHELNFNPVWTLPPTVIQKDLVPKGRAMADDKVDVLTKYGIDAYAGDRKLDPTKIRWNTSQPLALSYRQKPGKDNPLGFVKINFHNSHSVYLHDTPSDRLFGRNFRAASSGCVRVSRIEELVAWLLEDNKHAGMDEVIAYRDSGETKTITLKRPVPLKMVYITAWATEDGMIQFRRDLYHRDGVGARATY